MNNKSYRGAHAAPQSKKTSRKLPVLAICIGLLVCLTIGGTVAWLVSSTSPVENTFIPGRVETEVTESFDGTTKTAVNAVNKGNIDAYIRIKLVTYRVNEQGQQIGGTAEIPPFTLGEGWIAKDGYYYYTSPVAPGESPAQNLAERITLTSYTDANDADGGKQVIEVMAEAIQSLPASTVADTWHVTVTDGIIG